jgi:hypothetical protein
LNSLMAFLSISVIKFILSSTSFASDSTWALLKKNTTHGSKPWALIALKFLKKASNFFWPDF